MEDVCLGLPTFPRARILEQTHNIPHAVENVCPGVPTIPRARSLETNTQHSKCCGMPICSDDARPYIPPRMD